MTDAPGRGPRMSVVIPSYNHGRLIPEALAAISRQTMAPFEVVVVDDGSTDDSLARLQSLAAGMPWLRIHRHSEIAGSMRHAIPGAISWAATSSCFRRLTIA